VKSPSASVEHLADVVAPVTEAVALAITPVRKRGTRCQAPLPSPALAPELVRTVSGGAFGSRAITIAGSLHG
jgi:hypothetical protein